MFLAVIANAAEIVFWDHLVGATPRSTSSLVVHLLQISATYKKALYFSPNKYTTRSTRVWRYMQSVFIDKSLPQMFPSTSSPLPKTDEICQTTLVTPHIATGARGPSATS